ncbi:MAG TPA: LemA family protein [Bacteroidia bacterium]|jgi:LemA protein|nr:LemA family protein [Bacteroidia bacterium]
MNKGLIFLGVLLVIGIGIFFAYRNSYNTAVSLQETVQQKWGDVGADYQRRADLVPQLVATVKGAADNERTILTQVTNARAGFGTATTPEQVEALSKQVNSAINVVLEAYPEIRSTANFGTLQAQLEGTENRIAVSRKNYNEAVMEYNSHVRGFFNKMFLNSAEFPVKDMFKEDSTAAVAPKVSF